MTLLLITGLIIVGLILIALEILVFPGMIAGLLGLGALAYSVYFAFTACGNTVGWVVLTAVLLLSLISLIFIFRRKTWKKLQLDTSLENKLNQECTKILPGQEGTTVSRLAPTGKIEIGGEFYEAQSLSTFIDPRKRIRVAKVEGSKIYVEQY